MTREEKLEKYLRRLIQIEGFSEERLRSTSSKASLESMSADSGAAVEAVGRLMAGEKLERRHNYTLEAIVLPGFRPVFDILNGSYGALPAPWSPFNDTGKKSFVERCISGIGRLNISGHPTMSYVGTAFVVGENLLMTNRHVAEEFVDGIGFKPGFSASLDFLQEVGNTEIRSVKIVEPFVILEEWDAALLKVESLPTGAMPLKLASQVGTVSEGHLSAIIGYPAMKTVDVSIQEILQQIQIFQGTFEKKRIQPGRLMGYRGTASYGRNVNALAHDCSTLGGNSGSALLDLEAESVVGLHFEGEYLVANYSVPTWELATLKAVNNAKVIFQ